MTAAQACVAYVQRWPCEGFSPSSEPGDRPQTCFCGLAETNLASCYTGGRSALGFRTEYGSGMHEHIPVKNDRSATMGQQHQKDFKVSGSNPLNRALQILEVVASARRGISLVQIANITGLPQSITFRLVSNLVESEMLSFDPGRKLYLAGSRTERLAFLLQGNEGLETIVGPVISSLCRDLEETSFYVRNGTEGLRLLNYFVPEIIGRTLSIPVLSFRPMPRQAARSFMRSVTTPTTWT